MKNYYITESQLSILTKNIVDEQSVIGAPNYGIVSNTPSRVYQEIKGLDCVPRLFRPAVYELKNKNYNKLFLKTALGVIGRESDFGGSDRYSYLNPLKSLWAYVGGQTSVGYGQIKPETAKEFGLDVSDLNTASGALKGVYSIIVKNFNIARSVGYNGAPSSNFKDGTGNAALDIAIAAFNAGAGRIVKYCETSDPNIKKNCSLAGKTQTLDNGKKIEVFDKPVQNYLPNFKTKRWDGVDISTHGYVKEVADTLKKLNCF
jgi:hypothetical protein